MNSENKKYLKNWLTAAMCLELFPASSVDEVRKLATIVLDAVDSSLRRHQTTGVEAYHEALFSGPVISAISNSRAMQNTPPEWTEATLTRFTDFGPLLYVQDALYWMANLRRQVMVQALKNPQLQGAAERMTHCMERMRQNGISAGEVEELKTQMYHEWQGAKHVQPDATTH